MSDWTVETLREHLIALIAANDKRYDQRFEAAQKAIDVGLSGQKIAVDAALAAADRAVTKAELATEKRFEGVNEFRSTLSDQQRTLIPRAEVEVIVLGLNEKIATLEKQADKFHSEKTGVRGGWGYAVGGLGLVLSLLALLKFFL